MLWLDIIIGIILTFILFRLWFQRNPSRTISKGNTIVAPADGRIVRVVKVNDPGKLRIDKGTFGRIKTACTGIKNPVLITIVMTMLNVHWQRAPFSGTVAKVSYKEGKFHNAVRNAESMKVFENEKNEIVVNGKINAKVIQIAGVLARRIKCFVKKNQKINKGQIIGLITFGSQVALIVPETVKLKVKEGQRVRAGETIIGEIK